MKVIAYDPYVQAGRAAQMGVRLVDLDDAARRVRLHVASTCPRPPRPSA